MSAVLAYSRLGKALVVVALAVLAVPASGLMSEVLSSNSDENATGEGLDAVRLVGNADPRVSLEQLEQIASPAQLALPPYFEEEIGIPAEAFDVRVSPDGSIVGYVVDGAAENTRQLVSRHMSASGWSEVDLGAAQGVTYLKDSGSCRWGLATFTQVGSVTSVVFRCVVP